MACLVHHGILGQRWGIRRFQNGDGSYTAAGKQRYGIGNRGSNQKPEPSQKSHLTDSQKRAIKIGAVVVATGMVAVGGAYLYKSGKLNSLVETGKSHLALKGMLDVDSAPTKKYTDSDVLDGINPTGSGDNCYNTTVATVLRFFGRDVQALGARDSGKVDIPEIAAVFGKSEFSISQIHSPNLERVNKVLEKKTKDGDVGAFSFGFDERYIEKIRNHYGSSVADAVSGHVIVFKNTLGRIDFFDGQNESYSEDVRENLSKYMSNVLDAEYVVLGNSNEAEHVINDNLASRFVKQSSHK